MAIIHTLAEVTGSCSGLSITYLEAIDWVWAPFDADCSWSYDVVFDSLYYYSEVDEEECEKRLFHFKKFEFEFIL